MKYEKKLGLNKIIGFSPLSEVQIPSHRNSSFRQCDRSNGRNSLNSKIDNLSFNMQAPGANGLVIKVRQLEERICQIEKRLDVYLLKINQMSKESNEIQQCQKIYSLERKYEKVEYCLWETKQLEKQNRTLAENLNNQISQYRKNTDKSLKVFKDNNQLLLSTIETVLSEVLQKVEINRSNVGHQFGKICSAMEDICHIQSQNTTQKPTHPMIYITEDPSFHMDRSFQSNQTMQRVSFNNRSKSSSQRKTVLNNKKKQSKQQKSIF